MPSGFFHVTLTSKTPQPSAICASDSFGASRSCYFCPCRAVKSGLAHVSSMPMPGDVKNAIEGRFLLVGAGWRSQPRTVSIPTPFLPSCRQPGRPFHRTRHGRSRGRASAGG